MKPSSLNEIKKELADVEADTLIEFCMRLGKFKKENKELLTYLLFEAQDENAYVEHVKTDIDEAFEDFSPTNLYYAKKTIRKILRMANRQIRYSGIRQTELEIRIHFCIKLRASGLRLDKSPVLMNLFNQQLKKITQALEKLPEDLQFDYRRAIDSLS
jgi:hypothetical protein